MNMLLEVGSSPGQFFSKVIQQFLFLLSSASATSAQFLLGYHVGEEYLKSAPGPQTYCFVFWPRIRVHSLYPQPRGKIWLIKETDMGSKHSAWEVPLSPPQSKVKSVSSIPWIIPKKTSHCVIHLERASCKSCLESWQKKKKMVLGMIKSSITHKTQILKTCHYIEWISKISLFWKLGKTIQTG